MVKIESEDFVLNLAKSPKNSRLAIVVSKKVTKKAVERNRIKRLITESARDLALNDFKLLFIVKKNLASLKKDDIQDKIAKLVKNYDQKNH